MPRLRDLGVIPRYWSYNPGPRNSISDVKGVVVGHVTPVKGEGKLIPGKGPIRTGVTVVLPHRGNVFREKAPAAIYVINGFTKAIGLIQVDELGFLESPIALTNTLNIGLVADGLIEYLIHENPDIGITTTSANPVVLECNDSFLNDIQGRHVKQHHVLEAVEKASNEVSEGSVGAGTGLRSFGFKSGIGTASRIVKTSTGSFIVGVLVQSNFGLRENLVITGVPIGKLLSSNSISTSDQGSINIVIATNAPLTPRQLKRLAKRAHIGIARVGGFTGHGSGEVVVAFSTNYHILHDAHKLLEIEVLPDVELDSLFKAVVEATEEAILNSLFQSHTMIGRDNHVVPGIPVKEVVEIIKKYKYLLC